MARKKSSSPPSDAAAAKAPAGYERSKPPPAPAGPKPPRPDAGDTSDRLPGPPAGAAPEPAASDRELIERLTRERDEYLDDLKRERASFLNHKRWVEKERRRWEAASVCRLVESLLPFIDDMDRALAAAEEATDAETLRAGFKMICRRFREALKAGGVEEIPSDGEPFDPRVHEAILQVEDPDRPPGTVLETTHRGFRLKDRLIRASKVVVSKAPQPAGAANENEEGHDPPRTGEGDGGQKQEDENHADL